MPVVFYTNVKNHSIPTQWFFTSTCACAAEEEKEPRRAMRNHTARVGKQMYLWSWSPLARAPDQTHEVPRHPYVCKKPLASPCCGFLHKYKKPLARGCQWFLHECKMPLAWGCQWFFTRTRGPHGNRGGCCGILHVKNHSIWKPLAVVFYKNVKNHWQFCKKPQHPDGGDAVVFYNPGTEDFL